MEKKMEILESTPVDWKLSKNYLTPRWQNLDGLSPENPISSNKSRIKYYGFLACQLPENKLLNEELKNIERKSHVQITFVEEE